MSDSIHTPSSTAESVCDAAMTAALEHCVAKGLELAGLVVLASVQGHGLATSGYGYTSPAELIVSATVHLQDTAQHHGLAIGLTVRADEIPRHNGGGWTI